MKDIIKGSSIIFVFKVIGAISLFCINILISNNYGAKYLGIYNLLFSIFQISSIFSRGGLDIYVVKVIPSLNENVKLIGSFIYRSLSIILILSLLVISILFFGNNLINEYLFKTIDASNYLQILILSIIPFTFFTVIPEILRGFQEIKLYSFLRNGSQSLLILFFLFIIINYEYDDPINALFLGIVFSFLLATLILVLFLKNKDINLLKNKSIFSEPILRNSYPMFLTSSMLFLMSNIDSFMISYFESEFSVGLYNACLRLSLLVTFILTAVNGYVKPKVSLLYSQSKKKQLKKLYEDSLKLIWIIVFPVIVILYSFPSFFLSIFGDEFISANVVLIILNTSFLINAGFGPIGPFLNMTNRQKLLMKILIISLMINLIANYLFIPKYGITGAAYSTLLSTIFWNATGFYFIKRDII